MSNVILDENGNLTINGVIPDNVQSSSPLAQKMLILFEEYINTLPKNTCCSCSYHKDEILSIKEFEEKLLTTIDDLSI